MGLRNSPAQAVVWRPRVYLHRRLACRRAPGAIPTPTRLMPKGLKSEVDKTVEHN
jgi:hypothetical protein